MRSPNCPTGKRRGYQNQFVIAMSEVWTRQLSRSHPSFFLCGTDLSSPFQSNPSLPLVHSSLPPIDGRGESREPLAERDKHVTTPRVLIVPDGKGEGGGYLWKEGPNGRAKRGEKRRVQWPVPVSICRVLCAGLGTGDGTGKNEEHFRTIRSGHPGSGPTLHTALLCSFCTPLPQLHSIEGWME